MEGVNDALQHPWLQTFYSLRPVFRGVYVGAGFVKGVGPVGGGWGVGLKPGAVLMGVELHTHMVYSLWHILFALQNIGATLQRALEWASTCSEEYMMMTCCKTDQREVDDCKRVYMTEVLSRTA